MATTLAVLRHRATRTTAVWLVLVAALVPPASPGRAGTGPAAAPTYGWPVKPFRQQHPVRAAFGDPRIGMTPRGMRTSFHFGIDISCRNGTAVYATLDGVVRLLSFRPETVAIVGRDGHTEFQYWHIRPSVEDGQQVTAYRTVIGHVVAPWEHVHFAERRDDVYVNPLRPGAIGPFSDMTTPWIKQLRVEVGGHPVPVARGAVDLLVEAYDETPILVPGRWGGKPVTPPLVRWRLLSTSNRVVRPWRIAIDHRLTIPANDLYATQYGRWTRQNKRYRAGRYRFVLQAGWDSRAVPDGRYVMEVTAGDLGGNVTRERFPIRVANDLTPVS